MRQRVFWYVWNDDHEFIGSVLPPLGFALFDLLVVLFLLMFVYYNNQGVYSLSHPVSIAVVFFFILFVGALLWNEFDLFIRSAKREPDAEPDLNQRFTDGEHAPVFLAAAVMLGYFTVVACIDAKRG